MSMDVQRPSRKKEIRRRRILYGLIGVVSLVAVTVGINSLEPAAREVDSNSIWIQTVERGEMLRSVRGPGTLVPEEIRWISAETDGLVERIIIEPGTEVSAGEVILELSNHQVEQTAQDAELALRAAEAELQNLRARLDSQLLDEEADLADVKAEFERAEMQVTADRELNKDGLVSKLDLEMSELTAKQATKRHEIEKLRFEKAAASNKAQLAVQLAAVQQQRALYDLRKEQMDSLFVRSTIDGVLQQVPVEEGQRVTPGTNLARVAQPDKLKAELRINETQAKDILVGQVAQIDTRNGIVEGRVKRIDPAVQQGSVTVDVTLVGELPKGARPDLSVDGTIELERLEDVLFVGRPTYGQPNSTIGLFRVEKGTDMASRVNVRVGRTSVNTIEVIEGLSEGDEVILSDSSQWDDVDRIRLK